MSEPTPLTPPSANPLGAKPTETGSASLADDLMSDLTAPPAAPAAPATPSVPTQPKTGGGKDDGNAPATPAAKPAPPTPAKPAAATPPAKPAAPPAPKPFDPDDPKLAAPDLRKHAKQLTEDLKKTKEEKDRTVGELQTKLSDLANKKFWTDDDIKANQQLQERLNQLEQEKYGRDFRESPSYQKEYVEVINSQAKEAMEFIGKLDVKVQGDDELDITTRKGNWDDMMALYACPTRGDRLVMAKKLFPDDYMDVITVLDPMLQTRAKADQRIKEESTNYKTTIQQREQNQAETNRKIQDFVKTQTENLAKQYPDIFAAADDDKETVEALRKGFSFVDESASKQGMDINERAARVALIRAWAGAFPRLVRDINKLKAELATVKEENAKYRASDPSDLGDGGGAGGGGAEGGGGSDDLAAEITRLEQGL